MSRICITGIGGYLGLATAYKLKAAGHTIVGIGSSPERPDMLPEGVVYASIDIRDRDTLTAFLVEHAVETVYHFAAIKYVGKCETDPETCYAINTGGTNTVLEAMHAAHVPHIIYASTYAVYDWSGDQIVLTENTNTKPATLYGQSKLQSEDAIVEACTAGLISRYHILRYGNVIGAVPELPTHSPQSFVDKMVRATKTGETITLNGNDYQTIDGTVARDFIDIRDVAHVNELVVHHPTSAILNVSSGVATTLGQLLDLCEQISGATISTSINPRTGNEPSSISIDRTRLTTTLAYQPQFTLTDTVTALVNTLTT